MPHNIGGHRAPVGWRPPTAPLGSQRSQTLELGNHRVVVFSGHGSLNTITDAAALEFTVPFGTTIIFWVAHGDGLGNSIGRRIDARWSLQDLPYNIGAAVETIKGGQQCYNYRLTPPTGLALGNDPSKDPRFVINPQPVTSTAHISTRGLPLKDLIDLPVCRNASVHWAACRTVKDR